MNSFSLIYAICFDVSPFLSCFKSKKRHNLKDFCGLFIKLLLHFSFYLHRFYFVYTNAFVLLRLLSHEFKLFRLKSDSGLLGFSIFFFLGVKNFTILLIGVTYSCFPQNKCKILLSRVSFVQVSFIVIIYNVLIILSHQHFFDFYY